MGLISFVKNAGAKLFGRKKADASAKEAASQAELDAQKALELENLVRGLGIDISDMYIKVDDEVATVHGTSCCIEDKEKAVLAIGNVAGIATVDDRIIIEEAEELAPGNQESTSQASQYYTVDKGDSLSKIAKRFYGNALKYPVIFEANKPMLKDPNLIYPGQVLRIPPISE